MQGRFPAALLLACLCIPTARADCGEAVPSSQIVGLLEEAEWAYGNADLTAFSTSTDRIHRLLPCLVEELPRNIAARVHRTVGMRGFVDRNPDVSTRAFAAARSVAPAYRFPDSLVPSGNPLLADYQAIPVENGVMETVLAPADGYLVFDGRPGQERPRSWPTVMQFVSSEGEVTDTYYLWPDQSIPVYDVASAQPQPLGLPASGGSQVDQGSRVVSLPMLVTAGGLAIASGALYGLSRTVHTDYYDPSTTITDLEPLRIRHNGLVWGARGVGAAAALTGAGAFLVVRW